MKRPAAICPAPGCGARRNAAQAFCGGCWRLLPGDFKTRIIQARRQQARHVEAKAAMEATAWLGEHSPWATAAQRTGEAMPP